MQLHNPALPGIDEIELTAISLDDPVADSSVVGQGDVDMDGVEAGPGGQDQGGEEVRMLTESPVKIQQDDLPGVDVRLPRQTSDEIRGLSSSSSALSDAGDDGDDGVAGLGAGRGEGDGEQADTPPGTPVRAHHSLHRQRGAHQHTGGGGGNNRSLSVPPPEHRFAMASTSSRHQHGSMTPSFTHHTLPSLYSQPQTQQAPFLSQSQAQSSHLPQSQPQPQSQSQVQSQSQQQQQPHQPQPLHAPLTPTRSLSLDLNACPTLNPGSPAAAESALHALLQGDPWRTSTSSSGYGVGAGLDGSSSSNALGSIFGFGAYPLSGMTGGGGYNNAVASGGGGSGGGGGGADANEVPFLDLHYWGSPVVMSDAVATATEESRTGLALDLASSSSASTSSGSSLSTSAWMGLGPSSYSPQLAHAHASQAQAQNQQQQQQQQPTYAFAEPKSMGFSLSGMGRNGIGCVAPKALGAPFTIVRPTTAMGARDVDPEDGLVGGGSVVGDGFRGGGRAVGSGVGVGVAPGKLQMHQRGQSAVSPNDLLVKKGAGGRDNKRKRASWDGGPR